MSSTTSWSEANDQKLWSLRYKPTSQLASTFDKTQGAIRSRIKHLNDPNHTAYRRRVKNGIAIAPLSSTAARKQSAIMMASPFATGYLAASEALSSQKRSSSTNSNNNISNKKSKVQNSSINGGGGVIDLCDSSDDDLLSSLATKKKSSVSTSSSFTSTAAKRTSNTNTIGASSFAANYLAAKLSSSSSNSTSSNARTKSTNNNGRIDPSTLNTDQQSASKYIFSGGNAFLTG